MQMSVKHCGEMRDTPFCPQCGSELTKLSPVVTLLKHLKVSRDSSASVLKKLQDRLVERGIETDKIAKKLSARQRVVDKWQGWIDAVVELQRLSEQSEIAAH